MAYHMQKQIITQSATDLLQAIRRKDYSVTEVVEAYITQIEHVNPALNAVVVPMFEQARDAAQAADIQQEVGGDLPPLFGLPVTIKDALDIAGVTSACGMVARRDRIPEEDAVVVKQLRDAGAIILGKTNTPEACWAQETTNLLYGRTNNPWILEHTVAGSTGGEAAIIAACGSPMGIGSDISGSIRLPAALTGIVGLRPTSATLDERGHHPYAQGRLAELEAIGPMARRVEDVALAFSVLTGRRMPMDSHTLQGKKVAYGFNFGLRSPNPDIRQAVMDAVSALENNGMEREKPAISLRARFAQIAWMSYVDNASLNAVNDALGQKSAWVELMNHLRAKPSVSPEVLQYWLPIPLSRILSRVFNGEKWRERLYQQFLEWVGEDGVMICPIHPTTAPKHGWQMLAPFTSIAYQQWVNVAGLPALTVPTGIAANGFPTAVQIVAARHREDLILAAGKVIQDTFMPDWIAPPISLNDTSANN